MNPQSKFSSRLLAVIAVCIAAGAAPAFAKTIIDEWTSVQAPPPPKLDQITVDPKTTALLVLDLVKQTCNQQARPRCLASLPQVAKLIKGARDSKTFVVYSVIPGPATIADTLPSVKPNGSEPVVKAGPDKFIGTDLEKILKDKGIATVIVVGTTAQGAVLYTASHAALIGFNVIVPVDGMSADTPYAEQYVAWNMVNAPVVSAKVKLTAIDMLKF
ncbi:MAG TPA: cysteine hydrolase [Stellaceae bacterium]|nr:cysteine hydrolase [Stellaceae bacterium]